MYYELKFHRTVQWSGEYRAGLTLIYYRREGELEEIHIPGPSMEDLRFLVSFSFFKIKKFLLFLFESKNRNTNLYKSLISLKLLFRATNAGVSYEYTVANANITRTPEFRWEYMDWSVCTATCGGGTQVGRREKKTIRRWKIIYIYIFFLLFI